MHKRPRTTHLLTNHHPLPSLTSYAPCLPITSHPALTASSNPKKFQNKPLFTSPTTSTYLSQQLSPITPPHDPRKPNQPCPANNTKSPTWGPRTPSAAVTVAPVPWTVRWSRTCAANAIPVFL